MAGSQEPRIAAQQQVDLLQLLEFCRNFLQPAPATSRRDEELLLQPGQRSTAGGSGSLKGIGNLEYKASRKNQFVDL